MGNSICFCVLLISFKGFILIGGHESMKSVIAFLCCFDRFYTVLGAFAHFHKHTRHIQNRREWAFENHWKIMESLQWKQKWRRRKQSFFTIYLPSFQYHVKINDMENPLFKRIVKRNYLDYEYQHSFSFKSLENRISLCRELWLYYWANVNL